MSNAGYNFTERVRKVLGNARSEAVRLRAPMVETEHILLSLLIEGEGVGVAALQSLGIDEERLHAQVESMCPEGKPAEDDGKPKAFARLFGVGARSDELPYSRSAKKVLEHAMHHARELEHSYVGTEHLLLGLLTEKDGAMQALETNGASLQTMKTEVLRLLGKPEHQEKAFINAVWETRTDRELIAQYNLQPHPEGGYYREYFRSGSRVKDARGDFPASTAILYLLRKNEISKWHVITADEVWHAYMAAGLELLDYDPKTRSVKVLSLGDPLAGKECAYAVPAGHWQAARSQRGVSLMGCTVAPGFEFSDFRMVRDIPGHERAFAEELSMWKELL